MREKLQRIEIDRREFIEKLGIGAMGLGAAGLATAGSTATAAGYPANETLRVGLIGTGGRCLHALLPSVLEVPGVRITAVCDVWDRHLEEAKKKADPDAFATKDHHALLDRKDVDAVIIATPDHWHVPATIDACAAGKDVYVEKPLTHDLSEGRKVIDAQNQSQRIVQVGMQQRSMPQFLKGFEIIRSGRLGKIHRVHLSWNRNASVGGKRPLGIDPASVDWKRFLGNAKDQPFDDFRMRNWRWIWDFGGGILTDLMVHYIDVVHWYLDLDHPTTAVAQGDHFQTKGVWETPDTIETLLSYPEKQLHVFFEGTFFNARNAARLEFMGTEATMYLDRGRLEVHPEKAKGGEYYELVPGKGGRGDDFDPAIKDGTLHLAHWVECVRSRKKPNAPAESGVSACNPAHLGNKAYLTGQLARWEG